MREKYNATNLFDKYKLLWGNRENSIETIYPYLNGADIDIDDMENIYITKGNIVAGEKYPCFVCHLDTVHEKAPDPLLIKNNVLISSNGHGIGGDDKCGIVACIELLRKLPTVKIVMFVAEESGGNGASGADYSFFDDVGYIVEIDRYGRDQVICDSGGTTLCSDSFLKIFTDFGFEENNGIFTDVNVLKRKLNINMVNVSAGYYNHHRSSEHVILDELEHIIDTLVQLSEILPKDEVHKDVPVFTSGYKYGQWNNKKYGGIHMDEYVDPITLNGDTPADEKDDEEAYRQAEEEAGLYDDKFYTRRR